jgi:hypothetical protein
MFSTDNIYSDAVCTGIRIYEMKREKYYFVIKFMMILGIISFTINMLYLKVPI